MNEVHELAYYAIHLTMRSIYDWVDGSYVIADVDFLLYFNEYGTHNATRTKGYEYDMLINTSDGTISSCRVLLTLALFLPIVWDRAAVMSYCTTHIFLLMGQIF